MPNAKSKFEKRNAFADRSSNVLDAIIPDQRPAGVEDLDNARSIDAGLLESNPYQPRKTFPEAALAELAADIAAHGVLLPLLVRPHPTMDGRYQIVAGERRWRAAQRAGLTQVPCIERALDNAEMERLALVENIQRADLNPVDEARAYQRLIDNGASRLGLSKLIHKHHEYIAQRLRLLDDPRIEKAVSDGALGATVGQEIMRVKDQARRDDFIRRIEKGEEITVRAVKDAHAQERDTAGTTSQAQHTTAPAPDAPLTATAAPPVANYSQPAPDMHSTPPLHVSDRPGTTINAGQLKDSLDERQKGSLSPALAAAPTTPSAPRVASVDGLGAALGALDVAAVTTLLHYGAAEGWSCAQLLTAIEAVGARAK